MNPRPYHRMAALAICCFLVIPGCGDSSEDADSKSADNSSSASSGTESNGDDGDAATDVGGESNKVLRHAVFFGFKEGSTDEQIQEVVDAFRALPSKIDAITDFEWGTNNSPEELDDGYTHCFVLTFRDEAGREEYLPHPDHKAFGATLGPIRDKVFVIDYWADPPAASVGAPLRHMVFFKFKDDAKPEDVKAVEEAFAALPSKIDSIKAFEWGTNNSPETKDEGFTHCFTVTFDSEDGRAAYLPHDDHKAFVTVLEPVLDKVRVLDFNAAE